MVLAIAESDEVMRAIKSVDEGSLVSITAMALREGRRQVDGHKLPLQISGAQIKLIQDFAL
jgi:hypothetical protein